MEDTGHYHVALLKFLLSNGYPVALINPKTTDLTRKMEGGITKNDKLDTITICDVLDTPERKKQYRITKVDRFDFKAFTNCTNVCRSDYFSIAKRFKKIHVNNAIFRAEQSVEFRKNKINRFL